VAYRSRPRPSSTPDAKASTVCPYYLDGDSELFVRTEVLELDDLPRRSRPHRLDRLFGQLCSFQGPTRGRTAEVAHPPGPAEGLRRREAGQRPVSQNSTACVRKLRAFRTGPVDMLEALAGHKADGRCLRIRRLPRKEVIQPHLPVRLPCYDFTPITSPTFDGSLPKGLGHRLRVLPAFVV
jgi:hypothetical protein